MSIQFWNSPWNCSLLCNHIFQSKWSTLPNPIVDLGLYIVLMELWILFPEYVSKTNSGSLAISFRWRSQLYINESIIMIHFHFWGQLYGKWIRLGLPLVNNHIYEPARVTNKNSNLPHARHVFGVSYKHVLHLGRYLCFSVVCLLFSSYLHFVAIFFLISWR